MIKNAKGKRQKAKTNSKIQNLLFLLFTFTFLLLPFISYAQPISSTDLINNAKQYEGKTVVYQGEVIGDIMVRGEYAWINVNDGRNAIGVWLSADLVKDINNTGGYGQRGDWLEITGNLNKTCLEHGGDLDIHAQSLRKVTAGNLIQERLNLGKRNFAFILFGVLCLVLILSVLKAK